MSLLNKVFRQIRGFGEYGFPESHAASFALLVYVSAWLKRHYPAAFTAAILNSQPMGFYAPAQLISDARQQWRPGDARRCQPQPMGLHAGAPATSTRQAAWPSRPGSHESRQLDSANTHCRPASLGRRFSLRLGLRMNFRLQTAHAEAILHAPSR